MSTRAEIDALQVLVADLQIRLDRSEEFGRQLWSCVNDALRPLVSGEDADELRAGVIRRIALIDPRPATEKLEGLIRLPSEEKTPVIVSTGSGASLESGDVRMGDVEGNAGEEVSAPENASGEVAEMPQREGGENSGSAIEEEVNAEFIRATSAEIPQIETSSGEVAGDTTPLVGKVKEEESGELRVAIPGYGVVTMKKPTPIKVEPEEPFVPAPPELHRPMFTTGPGTSDEPISIDDDEEMVVDPPGNPEMQKDGEKNAEE